MPLVEHDDVIETLLAKGPDYPFGDRIRQRRPIGRSDLGDASTGEIVPEVIPIHIVPVMDQISRLAAPGGRFDRLSPDPCRRRAGGNVEVNQLPALVADEQEDVQSLEADRLYHE